MPGIFRERRKMRTKRNSLNKKENPSTQKVKEKLTGASSKTKMVSMTRKSSFTQPLTPCLEQLPAEYKPMQKIPKTKTLKKLTKKKSQTIKRRKPNLKNT